MPASLLGFLLLALLLLGIFVVALALALFLAAFLLHALAPVAGGGQVLTAATFTSLAAAALLAVGVLLGFLGLFAFSFPAVAAMLRLLRALAQVAGELASSPWELGDALGKVADVLGATGDFLKNEIGPGLEKLSGKMTQAGTPLPNVPTPSVQTTALWIRRDDEGRKIEGYLERPLGAPDVHVMTNIQLDFSGDLLEGTKNTLSDAASKVLGAGHTATGVGTDMRYAAAALKEIATVVSDATAP